MNRADRLKARAASEGRRVKTPDTVDYNQYDYPLFCFKHILSGYKVDDCEEAQKALLLSKMAKMSQQTWQVLMTSDHLSGSGLESIPVSQFTASMPAIITQDVNKLHVMRFGGTSHRLIGHRRGGIFHITHVDVNLTAYPH